MMLETESQTKTYTRPISATWWLSNCRYFMFMVRELTSVFVALYVLLFLYEIFLLSKGPTVHGLFQESLRSTPFVAFYVIALLFSLYHSWTWLGLATKIQVVKVGKSTLPPLFVALGAYTSWLVATIVIAYFFFNL